MTCALLVAFWLMVSAQAPEARPGRERAGDASCLACHGVSGIEADSGRSVYVDSKGYKASVHGILTCATCHTGIKDYPHPKEISKVDCASCHADVVRAFKTSIHAAVRKNGDQEGPTCLSCHGAAHTILPKHDPSSSVAKKNLPDTCGACHANPAFVARHRIPFARPVEVYRLSVHGRAVERGNEKAPSCSDCHGSHTIFSGRDTRSRVNHWNVVATCGACHTEVKNTYIQSVHGQAVLRGVRDAPVCTDCHGEHAILAPSEPRSLVNPARVSSVTCGRCHTDERLADRYNLPIEKVPAFEDSYHGLAMRAGSQVVANCASCHGVHNILPSTDSRSTIHPANLASTCGRCHPGAGKRFAIGMVHIRPATVTEHVVVKWIRVAYLVLIPLVGAFMLLHNALDFFAKLVRARERPHVGEGVLRMNLNFRIAHWLVVVSFPVLVLTGFALKFPEAWWAAPILFWESQFAFRGTLHRIAAIVLIASMVYHVIHLILSHRDRIILRYLRPGLRDLTELWSVFRFNLGVVRELPQFGKFSYAEKAEYWAFVWGTLVMAASGFLLWFNNFSLRNFPKWVSDAATVIHYYEAILATLAILLWHFYMVIFDPDVYPMDRTWLTGNASADHLRHTRRAYYAALLAEQETANKQSDEAARTQAPPQSPVSAGAPKTHADEPSDTETPPPPSGDSTQ